MAMCATVAMYQPQNHEEWDEAEVAVLAEVVEDSAEGSIFPDAEPNIDNSTQDALEQADAEGFIFPAAILTCCDPE